MTTAINANPGQTIALVLNSNDGYGAAVNFVQEVLPVNTNGQTLFILSQLPSSNSTVTMFVNGVKQVQALDYTISIQTITFLNNAFTLRTTDVVDFYYAINSGGNANDGYVPQIQSVIYPNGQYVGGFPQPMTLISGNVWRYNITLPSAILGTFVVLASYIPSSKTFIQTEVFLIYVALQF